MKRYYWIIIMMMLWSQGWATEYMVVTGTATNGNVPFCSGSNWQHIQILYSRSICQAAMGQYHHLAGIRFHAARPITVSGDLRVKIKIKTTMLTSLTSMQNFTTVVPVYVGSGEVSDDGYSILFRFEKSQYFDLNLQMGQNIIMDLSVSGLGQEGDDILWEGNENSTNKRAIYDDGSSRFVTTPFLPKSTFVVHEKHSVTYNGNSYDIYNDGMLSAVLSRFVCANSLGISNVTVSHERENPDEEQLYCCHANLYEIPLTIPKSVAGTVNDVSVTAVGNKAFTDLRLTEDIAITFGGIAQIGDNPLMPNTCFRCDSGPYTMNIVFYSTIPTLVGSYFEKFASENCEIKLLFNNESTFDTTWTGNILTQFRDIAWVSYPYQLTVYNAYGKKSYLYPGSADFITFEQYPYAERRLKISLNNAGEGHNDGAFHYYGKMLDVSSTAMSTERDVTVAADGRSFTARVNDMECFTITPKIHARLMYGVGDPYLSASQASIHLNNKDMFAGCDSVVFEYAGEEMVPYWEYIDDDGGKDALYTTADFHVIKEITNKRGSYFSFPFDVNVEELRATETGSGDSVGLTVMRYEGYDTCTQVTEGVLPANHGHIYRVATEGEDTVRARVVFRSGKTARRALYCSDCEQSIAGLKYTGEEGRRGWNLVGNPNYCYTEGSAYGRYVTKITDAGYMQSAWFDGTVIKPFEAVLYETAQAEGESGEELEFNYEEGYVSPNPYGNHSVNGKKRGTGEDVERVVVCITDGEGRYDRTGVIDDEEGEEGFRSGMDLTKLFNGWSQVYIPVGEKEVAFKSRAIREDSVCVVPLGFKIEDVGRYRVALDTATHLYGTVMIHDKRAGMYMPLTAEGTEIEFQEGRDTAGYELVIVPEMPMEVESVAQVSEELEGWVVNGHLMLENIKAGSEVEIYDMTGKVVYQAKAEGEFSYRFASRGVYVVTVRGGTRGVMKVVY